MHYDRARSSFATDLLSLTTLAEAAWAVMVSRGPKYGDGTEIGRFPRKLVALHSITSSACKRSDD